MAIMSENTRYLSDRKVIAITGPETRDFLQRVITTDMKLCTPGSLLPGALLTPQGKIICDFLIHGVEDGVRIEVFADAAEALVKRLSLYRLRAKAEISLADDLHVVTGTGAADPRSDTLPPRAILADRPATDGTADQARQEIASGTPAFGRDYGEADVFPTDVNLDLYGGIGWRKGCFIGQEVLSRMKRRGTIRKRSVLVEGEGLEAGQDILAGGKPVGTLTSASGSHAVGLVRIDRLETANTAPAVSDRPVRITLPDGLED